MTGRKKLLARLLEALLEEWGSDAVQETLTDILHLREAGGYDLTRSIRGKDKQKKESAVIQVSNLNETGERKELLMRIAEKYDYKHFLQNTSEIREFLMMVGERPSAVKDRSEAFKSVLHYLSRVPDEYLYKISIAAVQSGPAQLGPISDAMSAAASHMIRFSREHNK